MRKWNCNEGEESEKPSERPWRPFSVGCLSMLFACTLQCTLVFFCWSLKFQQSISQVFKLINYAITQDRSNSFISLLHQEVRKQKALAPAWDIFCPAHSLSEWYLRDFLYKMLRVCAQKVAVQNGWSEEEGQAHSNMAPPFASGMGNDAAFKEFQGTGSSCVCLLLFPPFPHHWPLPALTCLPGLIHSKALLISSLILPVL